MILNKRMALANIINSIVSNFELNSDSSNSYISRSDHYVLCLIDGLANLSFLEFNHLAPFLSSFDIKHILKSGFPSTTATCLTSLATGLDPIEHGIVGAAFKHNDLYFSPLKWRYLYPINYPQDKLVEPDISIPTGAWDTLKNNGININAILPKEIAYSTFTAKVFSAANIHGYQTLTDITTRITTTLKAEQKSFTYVYFGSLDLVGHNCGIHSEEWKQEFMQIDFILQYIHAQISDTATMLVTADHGMINIDRNMMIDICDIPFLYNQIEFICGDARARHIYLKPKFKDKASLTKWDEYLGEYFSIFTREEILNTHILGDSKSKEMHPRIGDLILISKNKHALIDSRSCYDQYQSNWVGHHGANTDEEQLVPLLIWNHLL